jgi:transposase
MEVQTREDRGRFIAENATLQRKPDGRHWLVPSQSGPERYLVDEDLRICTCSDFETNGQACKHVFAVQYTSFRRTNANGDVGVNQRYRVTYTQDWPAYNAAQTHEKERVAVLLRDLLGGVDDGVQTRGRPCIPLPDGLFCAVMKVYGGTSGRRADTDMREYAKKGLIAKAPAYNSIFKVLENPSVTPILTALISESAAPLSVVEQEFAIDSSGFSTGVYARWYDTKYGRPMQRAQWLKAHVMVGVRTNVFASAIVTDASVADAIVLPDLVDRTAERFHIERVSADKAYLSYNNLFAIAHHGAQPLIPFKSNSKPGFGLWNRAYHLFMFERGKFLKHYHQRSNVETSFSMVKLKFGTKVRSKTETAMVNEVLCKLLCHNLCCLVHAFYELGIDATFWKVA